MQNGFDVELAKQLAEAIDGVGKENIAPGSDYGNGFVDGQGKAAIFNKRFRNSDGNVEALLFFRRQLVSPNPALNNEYLKLELPRVREASCNSRSVQVYSNV